MTQTGQFSSPDLSSAASTIDLKTLNSERYQNMISEQDARRWEHSPSEVDALLGASGWSIERDEPSSSGQTSTVATDVDIWENWETASSGRTTSELCYEKPLPEVNGGALLNSIPTVPEQATSCYSSHDEMLSLPIKTILERAKINDSALQDLETQQAKVADLEQTLGASSVQHGNLQMQLSNCSWLLQKSLEFITTTNECQAYLRTQLDAKCKKMARLIQCLRSRDREVNELKQKQERTDAKYVDDVFGWQNRIFEKETEKTRLEWRIRDLLEIIRAADIVLHPAAEE